MAGTSKNHILITGNMYSTLRFMLRGTSCSTYQSAIKIRATNFKSYFYPDAVVSREEGDGDDYYLEKPCLIVEVLSESTEKRDLREKLVAYMNIPGLQAYILVAQDKPEVELYQRNSVGNWQLQVFEALDDEIMLPCVDQVVTLTEIYEDVFSETAR